jgi:hypothetical protein
MPGDPKEHRTHAARCAELAVAARTPQLERCFQNSPRRPQGFGYRPPKQHQRCTQQTSNDTKQCGDYAIKPRIIKYWHKRGIIDDQLALKLRGSVVAPPLQLCFEHVLVEHPVAQRRYRSQLRAAQCQRLVGVCGRPDWSPANMYPAKWCRGHTQLQCRARTTKRKPCSRVCCERRHAV